MDPAPATVPGPSEADEGTDVGLVFALGALSLVGVAVVGSQVPYGRFIAAGVSAVGLLAGLASMAAEGRARVVGGVAAGVHALVLLVVFLAPSLLDLDPWQNTIPEGPKGPQAISHADQRMTPAEWVNPAVASWQCDDVRVSLAAAAVGPIELTGPKDAKRTTKEQYLRLHIRVANTGVERQIDLTGWASGQNAAAVRVTDPSGKVIGLAAFDGGWRPEPGSPIGHLFPGQASEVKATFVAPPVKAEFVRVELPGAAVGLPEETIKFQVGGGFLTRPKP